MFSLFRGLSAAILGVLLAGPAFAQTAAGSGTADPPADVPAGVTLPADYRIGPEDVLSVVFWREKDMTSDVVVRPDGKITLPLLKDVDAAGYTPEELTTSLTQAAAKYISQPNVTVIVKAINSRKVYVLGQVAKPGAYPFAGDLTVLQAIALAGDVLEYAKKSDVVVVRKVHGKETRFPFNYKDVVKGKHPEQNIALQPGDTVIVP